MCHSVFSVLFILCLIMCGPAAAVTLEFDQNNNTRLNGSWSYYPNTLLFNHESLNNKTIQPRSVQLPNSFEVLSGNHNGIASFQQHFKIPPQAVGRQVYFFIPYQYGAYELYIDGHLLTKVGHVGSRDQHQTKMAPKLASFFPSSNQIEITLQVSSFDHIRGGLENPIYIGFSQPILHKFYRQIIPLCVVIGMLLMIGSFMLLFALYKHQQGTLHNALVFLALFILCFSLRSFFAVPFIYTLFTDISWVWGTRFEYLFTEFSCLFFLMYIYRLRKKLLHPVLFYFFIAVVCSSILMTLTQQPILFQDYFFKTFTLSLLFFANLIYGIIRIVIQKSYFSRLNAFAIFILCMTFLNDYLLGLGLIDSVEIGFYSSCIYFICVTFQLSHDYANQSNNTVQLNRKLIALNRDLDAKVLERTATVLQLNAQLEQQVRTDALTGAFNRHALNIEIQKRYQHALDSAQSLTFMMIDLDFFKNYNDMYGHLNGDDVLKNLVAALDCILPSDAFLARYGGEEFAILLSDKNERQVQHLAEQCVEYIRMLQWPHLGRLDTKKVVTISMGVAVMNHVHRYDGLYALMKAADESLYRAKVQRDCAMMA